MSKKSRKKSSKLASGRLGSTKAKTTGKTARKAPKKAGTKKATAKTVRKAAGKAKTTTQAAKSKASKTAVAKVSQRSGAKIGTTRKATSKPSNPKSRASKTTRTKPAATPVRVIATLNEGDHAPAFSLPRDGGQIVSLADYAGRKLVIFFYPRADTPGCTLEAVAFSRLDSAFAAAQTAVLGVSADPVTAQDKFRDKHELTVPLVSDETLGMLKAYGVWGEKSMYGKTFMGISRTTVLVDGDGRIARIWRNVKVDGHADEVLAAARLA